MFNIDQRSLIGGEQRKAVPMADTMRYRRRACPTAGPREHDAKPDNLDR